MIPTDVLRPALIVLAWLMALSWFQRSVMALRGMASVLDLTATDECQLPPLPERNVPDVTVIVPARDEQDSIEATLESLLRSEAVRAQIVAIDDRSDDRTGEVMDAVASRHRNDSNTLEVIHNRELPEGWLGKPHALALGVARARAPWLLFTDGDVTFAPQALELALRAATKAGANHFVLVPTLTHEGVLAAGVQGSIQALGQWAARMWKVQDPNAKDFFGVGGFQPAPSGRSRSCWRDGAFAHGDCRRRFAGLACEEGIAPEIDDGAWTGARKNRVDARTIWNCEPPRKECLRRISLQWLVHARCLSGARCAGHCPAVGACRRTVGNSRMRRALLQRCHEFPCQPEDE